MNPLDKIWKRGQISYNVHMLIEMHTFTFKNHFYNLNKNIHLA